VNTLGKHDRDLDDYTYDQRDHTQDREISLGTGTILGIFFALAVVCAIFFGFGYTMGRKSAAAAPVIAAAGASDTDPVASGGPGKPRSGSPFQTAPQPAAPDTPPATDTADAPAATDPTQTGTQAAQGAKPYDDTTTIVRDAQQAAVQGGVKDVSEKAVAQPVALHANPRSAAAPGAAQSQATAPAAMPAVSSTGTAMVQIAAVSHQEDADLLLAALKKRGYPVFLRQESQDHLLHIQVGPFATHKDADAMRQRLLNDGYNAIIK
jgi:cell division protein FtsN